MRRERGVGVGVHVVVGDADAVVVVEVDAVVREQQLEHVVALGGRARDRAEDADPRRRVAERVEHPERDRGLAGVAFGRRDVDAGRHAAQASRRACHAIWEHRLDLSTRGRRTPENLYHVGVAVA